MEVKNWKTVDLTELAKQLASNLQKGLSTQEAEQRLKRVGPNTIERQSRRWYKMLASQFTSPFIMLLLVAAGLSFFIENIMQGLVIITMLGVNAFVESYQEYKSSRVLELLQNLLTSSVVVVRNGEKSIISEEELVPGDLVVLNAGDKIPADLRIVSSDGLLIDESLLTGESEPVSKSAEEQSDEKKARKQNCCFAGSTVISGQAIGIITVTGNATELGEITELTTETSVAGVFAKDLNKFTWLMIALILGAFFMVLIIKWYIQEGSYNLLDILMFALVVAVSITPESLPVIITFALSQAAHNLAQQNVVVKRLSALNDLGGVEILCVDKTGTLTENKLELVAVWNNNSETVIAAFLGSGHLDAEALQDPLDKALWNQLLKEEQTSSLVNYSIIKEIPFDPIYRRSGAIVKKDDRYFLIYRGAFESLIEASKKPIGQELNTWLSLQKKEARKVFAVAQKELTADDISRPISPEEQLSFIGYFACIDPIKSTVIPTLTHAQLLSVAIKVISGDAPEVVAAVGRKVGLLHKDSHILLGDEFEKMNQKERCQAVKKHSAFARVTPSQKYAIVQTLQKKHVVGFLGDGINDAPVLKLADVGIAVQGSVDIAQEAADVILLEKSLNGIIEGIAAGRTALVNAKKYLLGTLSLNMSNGIGLVVLSLLVPFLPILPSQLLLMHSLADIPMFALAVDKVETARLATPTRFHFFPLMILLLGFALTGSSFTISFFVLFRDHPLTELRAAWLSMGVLMSLILLFSARSYVPIWQAARPSNWLTLLSSAVVLAALAIPQIPRVGSLFGFTPPSISLLLQTGVIVLLCLVLVEAIKAVLVYLLDLKENG